MGLFDRMGQAIRAQVNSLIQENQDPEKLLEKAILEMEGELIKMRQALAEAVATQKRTERQRQQQEKAAQTWHERAQLALNHGNEELARQALAQWQTYQSQIVPLQTAVQQQTIIIQNLKKELLTIERKYADMKAQKSLYVARLRSASATQKVQEIMGSLNSSQTGTIFEKLEAKVLEAESQADLMQYKDPLERKFQDLEGQKQIEAELFKMKQQEFDG
jgi:phage shock protein A